MLEMDALAEGAEVVRKRSRVACVLSLDKKEISRYWVVPIFVLVFAANLVHHFLFPHAKVTFAFDAHYYMVTCSEIIHLILDGLHGRLSWDALSQPSFVLDLVRDGPVIPGIPALMLCGLGRGIEDTDWRLIVVLFSGLQSLAACLVGLICFRITGVIWAGVVAALVFGLYPAALVASGLYRSEVLVTVLALLFVLSLSMGAKRLPACFVAGVMGGLLCMAKAALIPVVGLAIGVGAYFSQKQMICALIVFMALALTIAPWAIYSKLTTGRVAITAERLPTYNAAVGCDLETDGWCADRVTEHQQLMIDVGNPGAIVIGQWIATPMPMLTLSMRKISRLFASPWNDFREVVFGVPAVGQQYIHLIILWLGAFGACVYLFQRRHLSNIEARLLADLTLIMILGHFSYVLFQAMGRYGYTAMPFVCVFVGYGIFFLKTLKKKRDAVISCVLATLIILLLCKAEAFTRINDTTETTHVIRSGDVAKKEIDLSATTLPKHVDKALIVIDSSNQLSDSRIAINGHAVRESVRLLRHFGVDLYRLFEWYGYQATLSSLRIGDFRQWRAVPVPVEWINLRGANEISIAGGAQSVILYGDSNPTRRILSSEYGAADMCEVSMEGTETRLLAPDLTARIEQKSLFVDGHKCSQSALGDSLRIKLALFAEGGDKATEGHASRSITGVHGVSHCVLKLDPAQFNALSRDASCSGIKVNQSVLKHWGRVTGKLAVPRLVGSPYIEFKLKGECRVRSGPGKISLVVIAVGSQGKEQKLAMTLDPIRGSHDWTCFEITDLLPTGLVGNELKQFRLEIFPLPWQEAQYGADRECSEAQLRNIEIELWTRELPDFSHGQALFY